MIFLLAADFVPYLCRPSSS